MPRPLETRRLTGFTRWVAHTAAFDFASRLLAAVTALVLIRRLAPDQFASYTVALALAQLLSVGAGSGIRMRYLREEAERISRASEGAQEHIKGQYSNGFASAVWAQLVLIAIASLAAIAVIPVAGVTAAGLSALQLVALCGVFACAQALTETVIFRRQAQTNFARAGLISVARSCGLLVAAGIAILISANVGILIVLNTLALCAVFSLQLKGSGLKREFNPKSIKRYLWNPESGWLSAYYVAAAGYATADIFVASALLPADEVAAFGVGQRFNAIALGALPVFAAVMRVRTSQIDIVASSAAQRDALFKWLKRTSLPIVIAAIVAIALSHLLIPLVLGGRYPSATPIFQILILSSAFMYLFAPVPSLLMAQRRYRFLAIVLALTLGVNVLVDVLACRLTNSAIGLAVASAATAILSSLLIFGTLLNLTRAPMNTETLEA